MQDMTGVDSTAAPVASTSDRSPDIPRKEFTVPTPDVSGDPRQASRSEVEDLYMELLSHWNSRNAAAYAGLFTPEGHVVGFDGSVVDDRANIEAHLSEIFADHPTATYVPKVRGVEFLSPDVALLRAVVGMVPPGQTDLNPAANAIQTLVAVRHDGQWRIAMFQNTPAAFHGRPHLVEELTQELREVLRARTGGRAASPGQP